MPLERLYTWTGSTLRLESHDERILLLLLLLPLAVVVGRRLATMLLT